MKSIVGKQWKPVEISFQSTVSYQDPFNEVEFDALITDEEGQVWKVPGFWAGEDLWKIRYSAPHAGLYEYQTVCTNAADTGLHEQRGSISIAPYDEDNKAYIHGPLRIMQDGRHFEFEDGTPFAWLGDTWWNMESSRLSEDGEVQFLAKDRADKGFNIVQFMNGFWCDLAPWDKRMANAAGFAWTKDFGTINPTYFDIADKKVEAIADAGLMMAVGGTWGFYIDIMGLEKIKKHMRYTIARYGAYPVVWLTAGEIGMLYYDQNNSGGNWMETGAENKGKQEAQSAGWEEVIRYIRQIDPYRRLLTAHTTSGFISSDVIKDTDLLDFVSYQAGTHTENMPTIEADVSSMTKRCLQSNPNKPVVNLETCYEGMMYECGSAVQRWLFWHTALNGCAGWSYGANGIFTMSHEKDPFGAAQYGINWGEQSWQEASQFEGATQIGHSREFLDKYPWWNLQPADELIENPEDLQALMTGQIKYRETDISAWKRTIAGRIGDDLIIGYGRIRLDLDNPEEISMSISFKNLQPGSEYDVLLYNPIRNYEVAIGKKTTDDTGHLTVREFPATHDWVIVLKKTK